MLEEGQLAMLVRHQMDVADVQHPDRPGARGQDRQLELAQRVAVDLDVARPDVRRRGGAERDNYHGKRETERERTAPSQPRPVDWRMVTVCPSGRFVPAAGSVPITYHCSTELLGSFCTWTW